MYRVEALLVIHRHRHIIYWKAPEDIEEFVRQPDLSLELCVEHLPSQSQRLSIKAVATITMVLMQKYEKVDGVVVVDDLDRWPIDLDAFGVLSAYCHRIDLECILT